MSAARRVTAVVICLGALIGLTTGPATAGPIVFSQFPSTFPVSGSTGIYFTQRDTEVSQPPSPPLYQQAYDNFTLAQPTAIKTVQWQGGYNGGPPGNITAFHLNFYSDQVVKGVHQPGTLLPNGSYTILGNAGESPAGNPNTELGTGGTNWIFNYAADLSDPFVAKAGTEYWLSIFPDLDSSTAGFWGWHTSNIGDGTLVLDTFDPTISPGAGRYVQPSDLAFSLAADVPEPTSLVLLGLGVAGLAGWARLRRKKRPA